MKAKVSHAVMGNNSMRCLNCGCEQAIPMPVSIRMMTAMCGAFTEDHADCKQSAAGRARFEYTTPEAWLRSWDTGASSLTIFNFMRVGVTARAAIPYDPADFGRCYRLLKAFPDWRVRMSEMGERIPEWKELATHWDELERLFEEESANGDCPKLYKRLGEIVR